MIRQNNLEALFDDPGAALYADAAAEIAAIRSGRKRLSFFLFARKNVDDPDDDFAAIVRAAMEANVTICVRPDEMSQAPGGEVCVFACREEDAWRIPALLALRSIMGKYPWGSGLEAFQSTLLGYTEQEIADWTTSLRDRGIAWGLTNLYMLMPAECRRVVVEHGGRSFPNGVAADSVLTCFASRRRAPLRRDAVSRLSPSLALARVQVSTRRLRDILGESMVACKGDVVARVVGASELESLNGSLESRFEFLGADGAWE